MFKLISQCWLGEVSLKKAFWLIYVLFGLINIFICDFVIDAVEIGAYTPFYIHNYYMDQVLTLAFPYLFLSSMVVWINGKNSLLIWNLLSKLVIVCILTIVTFHLIWPF